MADNRNNLSNITGWIPITEAGLDPIGNRANANLNVIDGKILSGTIVENMLKLRPKYVYDEDGTVIGTVKFSLSN